MKRREHFELAFRDAPTVGYVIECGVGEGRSMTWLVRLTPPNQRIFGFDSFEGLPEDWAMGPSLIEPAGSFKYDPPKFDRLELRVGLFEETLPKWKEEHPGRIAFLHIDSDLYSSCATALTELNDQIVPGTVIVFDEFYESKRYKYWEQGEYRAVNEWIIAYNRRLHPLAKSESNGEASFRVIR